MINAAFRILVRLIGLVDIALACVIVERASRDFIVTVVFAWFILMAGAALSLFVEAVIP
ncbi:MAG TPA: hypothetical protein VJ818_03295 [Actinomycetota bacterium]|nr:hypothetical protein [Actinomycetota bacterium]